MTGICLLNFQHTLRTVVGPTFRNCCGFEIAIRIFTIFIKKKNVATIRLRVVSASVVVVTVIYFQHSFQGKFSVNWI